VYSENNTVADAERCRKRHLSSGERVVLIFHSDNFTDHQHANSRPLLKNHTMITN